MAEGRAAVDAESQRYGMMPPLSGNMCEFWQICPKLLRDHVFQNIMDRQINKYQLAIMFRVAVASDLLLTHASEHVFSSSKKTTTLRRVRLPGVMLEILQVLKYSLKQCIRGRGSSTSLHLAQDSEEQLVGELFSPVDTIGLLRPQKLPQMIHHLQEALGDR